MQWQVREVDASAQYDWRRSGMSMPCNGMSAVAGTQYMPDQDTVVATERDKELPVYS